MALLLRPAAAAAAGAAGQRDGLARRGAVAVEHGGRRLLLATLVGHNYLGNDYMSHDYIGPYL